MPRYAVLTLDKSGEHRVKAVVEGAIPPKVVSGDLAVPVRTAKPTARLLGCKYQNGDFVPVLAQAKVQRAERLKSTKINKLVWCYHDFHYGNSLAHIGRESVRWFKRAGIPIYIRTWDGKTYDHLGVPNATDEDLKTSAVILMDRYPVPEKVFKMLADAPFIGGYYMLEGSRARTFDLNRLEAYDAVFTPSSFCLKVLTESGLQTPIYVWGHGFDHEVFRYTEPKHDRPFTFLWFGDENRRKGYDLFLQAFSQIKDQNVRAWVHGPGSGGVAGVRKNYEGDPRIVWDTNVVEAPKLREMMAEVDVLVAPYRGEGFCLPALEAMASGRPCIMTKWSGPLDFGCGDDVTYWIKTAGHEPAQNDEGVQVIPDLNHLISLMRECISNPAEVKVRGQKASRYTQGIWRWEQKVMEVLPILRKMIPNCAF